MTNQFYAFEGDTAKVFKVIPKQLRKLKQISSLTVIFLYQIEIVFLLSRNGHRKYRKYRLLVSTNFSNGFDFEESTE